MEAFARDLGDDGPPFRWDEERRFVMRAELDAAYFHLYGIERDDVDYVMETFPIVKRKDEQRYGSFRTKELILEVYDAMAEAIRTGDAVPDDPRPAAWPWASSPGARRLSGGSQWLRTGAVRAARLGRPWTSFATPGPRFQPRQVLEELRRTSRS